MVKKGKKTYHRPHGILIERVIPNAQNCRQEGRGCRLLCAIRRAILMRQVLGVQRYHAIVYARGQLGVLLGQVIGGDISRGNS